MLKAGRNQEITPVDLRKTNGFLQSLKMTFAHLQGSKPDPLQS